MKPNEASQAKLTSLNDIISPDSQAPVNQITYNTTTTTKYTNPTIVQDSTNRPSYTRGQTTTTTANTGPQVKITRKVVTTQPVTQTTTTTRKIVTTTTIKPGEPNQNTRYSNTNTLQNIITSNRTMTNTSSKPTTQPSSNYSRGGTVTNNNLSSTRTGNINTNNNQNNRNNQRPAQSQRVQNSQSYSGNRNQPKRVEVSSSHYKPKAKSPEAGTIKRKTINRGKPVENVQITHIIYSARPLEFHITEDLNSDNLNTQPIQISEEERNNLQKSGKVEVSYCCSDKGPKPVNLDGTLTHYQHAQGLGMTDDNNKNINKKFYQSEIKQLEPILYNKGEPVIEHLEFRSAGKSYNNANTKPKIPPKTVVKPTTNYKSAQGAKTYTQNRTYTTTTQDKNTRGGPGSAIKTTTTTTSNSNFRGSSGTGDRDQIVKETTTKVQMGNRSQFQNQSKPVTSTTTERKIYTQTNFLKK